MPWTSQEPSLLFLAQPVLCEVKVISGSVWINQLFSSLAYTGTDKALFWVCDNGAVGGGAGSTRVKSLSWGPADWIGVSGLLEVEGQLAQKLTCLLCERWT